ncbi:MAG: protein translocase subunit SecD [Armatimonadetes bacterium]|nr:protein translocase subunit SecD [Armatimonadota bacterium]
MDWNRYQNPAYLVLVLLLTVAGFFQLYNPREGKWNIKLGLDLRSGSRIVVQLKAPQETPDLVIDQEVVERTRRVFEKRLNPTGTREVIIQPEGVGRVNRLIIELPEVTDIKWAEEQVGRVARLEFKEERYNPKTRKTEWVTVMDGTSLRRADFRQDTAGANTIAVVTFELNPDGAQKFGELTTRLVNKPLGIFFDRKMVSAPNVQEPITQGSGQISPITSQNPNRTDLQEAKEMADLLNAGALPVDVDILSSMTVSPTLGAQSLHQSLLAGGIGLGVVILFMLFYYRVPGIAANIALVVYTILTLASMVIGGFVLTLPGIAGFVLSIGMAVDANVLIFERLKEELWNEKGLHSAVETGFNRAFSSILDGHVTTFIGAAILYYIASGSIKGFGLTLMLGTVWSMITAVYFTRVFMNVLVDSRVVTNRTAYGA